MKAFLYSLWEIFEVVLVAVIVVLIVRNFLIQPFLVSGASMEPNFSSGDYLLIDGISYRFREPQRGEVAVFHYPSDKKVYYIKRIIGLPGEKLAIKNGEIVVFNKEYPEGFTIGENYLPPTTKTSGNEEIVLKDNEYFMLGDNRNYSYDSRSWGSLSKNEIVGMVRLRLWPFNEVMAFEKPAY
ncbi:MAG: Signal peptidase IB [Actinobacteria bacterium]|nr:Signal peptidase IB [Actinomycetota bacterium]